jgi:hypothetical protein
LVLGEFRQIRKSREFRKSAISGEFEAALLDIQSLGSKGAFSMFSPADAERHLGLWIWAFILGSAGSVYGWALGISVSILTANVWGLAGGEWNGASFQPKPPVLLSTVLLIASVFSATRLPR